MANYDEVVKRNKDYLTQAQINALAAASKEYNIANAGNRAGALASAREQYDTAYRGLQNMGLAGNPNAAPASGEVPRLQMQVKTPFESYNERLKQVENQRLGALGEQFKQDTIAQRQAEEAARAAQAEAMRRAQLQAAAQTLQSTAFKVGTTVMQGFANKVMGIPSTKKENPAVANATKAQIDGVKRTEQVRAAAAGKLYNVTSSVNAAQERGAKLTQQYKGSVDTSDKNMYVVDEKAQAQRIQDVTAKARADFDAAQKNVTNLAQARHGGGNVSKEEYENAVAQRDLAKKIADNPDLAKAFVEKNNPNANIRSDANKTIGQFFGKEIAGSLGYEKPTMTDYQFNTQAKIVPDVRRILRVIDAERNPSGGARVDQDVINEELAELEKLGHTEESARKMLSDFDSDRNARMYYPTFENAYVALYSHDGEKPNLGINSKETDATYRAVNNLPDLAVEKYNNQMLDNPQLGPVDALWTDQQKALGNVDYMTKEQRDAYNSIYEREGIEAANQYAKDIQPIVELKRAADDQDFLETLATNNGLEAWALARATNLISSIPAMVERLSVGVSNQIQDFKTGSSGVHATYSPNSAMSRASNWADIIQSKQSQNILDKYNAQGREGLGKVVNFLYQTGTSMADSAIAMTLAGGGAPWMVDALFFSSAGNQGYKDAIARGGTQEQAMAYGILSGIAEALFEHLSIEHFLNMDHKGKFALIRNMMSQSFAEASEEVSTEIANILSDVLVMKDKSEYNELVSEYGEEGAIAQLLKNVSMAGLGGLASGLGFGVIGTGRSALNAAMTAREKAKIGAAVKEYGDLEQLKSTGVLLGGDALAAAEKVEKNASNYNVGALYAAVNESIQNLNATDVDSQVAVQRSLDGKKMTTEEASDVLDVLKPDTVAKLGYDTSSPEAFASSYNERVEQHGITSKAERMAKSAAKKFAKAKEAAANRVWANPEQGLAMTTPEGNTVTPMPGNMTAVGLAEQERTGFKTRSSATKGNVTYAVAGMEARQGLSNEKTYAEIQKGFTKEARKKAQIYEKLADALGVKMVIHDVMVGTNGFIDENGNMHVVLSGKQSVLRVAAHELTHWMKDHDRAAYRNLRQHLIAEVGRDKFEKMFKQKAREYGIDTSTKKGIVVVDDEVCAELCERMLSNEESLTKFAERDTAAAKTLKQRLTQILDAIRNALRRAENRNFGESWSDLIKQQETVESWVEGLQKAVEKADKQAQTTEGKIAQTAGVTTVDQQDMLGEIKDAKTDKEVDEIIDRHSVDVFEYDMAGYMDDLLDPETGIVKKGVMSETEVKDLFKTLGEAVKYIKTHRDILDFGEELDTVDKIKAAKEGRAYKPYKPNADPHYKLALDFSTLCKKRVLLQMIQERLQAKLGRSISPLETIAIRRKIQALQREGVNVEVACALCYVEAARLKSPKVINEFLGVDLDDEGKRANVDAEMRNHYAQNISEIRSSLREWSAKWKTSLFSTAAGEQWWNEHGSKDRKGNLKAPSAATKKQIDAFAKSLSEDALKATYEEAFPGKQLDTTDLKTHFETLSKGKRTSSTVGAEQEKEIAYAKKMVVEHPEVFLSEKSLRKMKLEHPDVFAAFTNKVRSATRSKALEGDTFYSRGDISMVSDAVLDYANAESGFRHQSWSDFMPIHLLDTVAAIIEMSQRDAKMHAYTKVPAMVELLGNTGMMLNMSLIPKGEFGIDKNGNLIFDPVEGMDWDTMMRLRDAFPDTAGNIAIGISDEQIQKLLSSKDIDYVIPYHVSGLNKALRTHMGIHTWLEYTASQNEKEVESFKKKHKDKKMKPPALKDWFHEDQARAAGKNGVEYMQKAAQDYLDICARDGWIPKFSQYLEQDADGRYHVKEGYENYWKLLIDRKMVNQKTGNVIIQQAVKPKFEENVIMDILKGEAEDPTNIRNAQVAEEIAGELEKTWRADRDNSGIEEKQIYDQFREDTALLAAERSADKVKAAIEKAKKENNTPESRKIKDVVSRIEAGKGTEVDREFVDKKAKEAHAVGARVQRKLNPIMDAIIDGDDFFTGKLAGEKSTKSIVSKIMRKAKDPLLFGDLARGCFLIRDYDKANFTRSAQQAINELEAAGVKVVEVDDKFAKPNKWGYRGLHLGVELGGITCELQFATKELWDAVKTPSENIYGKWRDRVENKEYDWSPEEWSEYEEDRKKSVKMWEEAVEKYHLPDGVDVSLSNSSQEMTLASQMSQESLGSTQEPSTNSAYNLPEDGEAVMAKKLPSSTITPSSLRTSNIGNTPFTNNISQGNTESKSDLEVAEENIRYSLADEALASRLDDEELVPVYRAMQVIDGKLYPPMAAKVKDETGKANLVQPTEIGKWYVSDERPDLIDPATGKWALNKGNKSSPVNAAYNPYFHTSTSPLNDQFSSAYKRPNLVVVEGYVPKSELTSGYKAQYAKDAVGAMRWHSGPVSSKLSTPRTVILSRYFKVGRILSDVEVASKVADLVKGQNVSIPQNTVTPGLYDELNKLGVPTTPTSNVRNSLDTDYMRLAEKKKTGTADTIDTADLQKMVFDAADKNGFTYRRNSKSSGKAYNDVPYQMFVEGDKYRYIEGNYGDYKYVATDKNATNINDIMDDLKRLAEEYYGQEVDESEINPPDIVDSAGVWDDLGFFQYAWDNYFEDEFYKTGNIPAIITSDGLLVLGEDESRVKSADPVTYDDNGNIIPLSERFNTQKQGIRYDLDTETLREIQPPTIEQQVWESNDNIRYSTDTRRKPEKKPGMKPAGREPRVREVDVPQYAKTGNPVSDFVRSFLESDKATEEMVRDLQQKIEDGDWGSYTRLTNKEAMDRASDYIARRSLAQAQSEFHDMVASGKYNVNTRALGLKLLSEAASRGDQKQVLDIAADLRELATDAGQSVQIFNVLKGLGGLGSAWYMQRKIEKLNSKYAKEIAAGKMDEITVSPDLMQDLAEARTTAEVEQAEDAIAKEIALQLPLTWASRISNWRYLAMLGNPTTHFRNITGNAFMTVLNTTKDAVATGIEKLAVKDVSERAHAVLTGSDRKTWGDFASKSFKEQEKNLRGTGKYGFENQLKQYMRSFDTKWLNKLAQFNFDKLEQEDLWFIRPAYRNALMQHMKAQGYTLQDGKAGKMVDGEFKEISTEEMNKAIEWASNQAWKATFRDASTVASVLNSVSKKLGPVGHVIIEGVMPFKKTPINIARRGIEYSPAGIIIGAVQLAKDVKTGKVTKAQAIDNLASGLVGTALMALGAALAKAGIIRAGGDDDKKLGTYNTDTGKQAYSIQIGNVSIDISALAPSTIPLFMGAALHDALDKNGEGLDPSALVETAASTLNPFMEMSFMSSLNSALKNYGKEGIGGALGNTLLTAAESYGSQFLPTVVGKIGQAFDPTTRTTKSSAASPLGSNLDYYGRSLIKKVPGLEAMLQPDVNVWGRETKKDTFGKWALDWANKFILPVGVKIAQKDAIDDELIRLVESTGNVDILPSDGPKKFTVDGETYPMTAAQYTQYSKDRGQASYAALKETMLSSAYKTATDEERAGMLQNALSAAQQQVNTVWKETLGALDTSKQESGIKGIKGDYSDPALYKVAASYPNMYDKAAKAKSQGVSPDTFLSIYDKKENYVGDDRSDYVRQEIMNSNLTPKQKELMDDLIVSDKGTNPDYSSQGWFKVSMLGENKYKEAKMGAQVGLKPETYYKVYTKWKTLDAKDENGKTVNGLKKKRAKEYLDSLTLSGPEYSFIWTVMFGY